MNDLNMPASRYLREVDSKQFERLVDQHKDSVYRQMVRVCNQKEDAEDALATALMLAFRAHEQLESDTAFRSWLGTIGKRVCTRMRSHPNIERAFEFAEEHDLIASDKSEFDIEILKGCIREAIENLPPIYRDIYLLCELNEESVASAAGQLGISHNAAKSRLLRARQLVREKLDHSICAA